MHAKWLARSSGVSGTGYRLVQPLRAAVIQFIIVIFAGAIISAARFPPLSSFCHCSGVYGCFKL